jgi:voltage-gated potassium channel Kch
LTLSTAVYFSFVTLATVGYGDVVPARELSRGVAMFEALVGQLFLAVLIARLVSVYVGRR